MTDERVEQVLRATLSARADTVTRGPDWDGGADIVEIAPRRHRARRLAPLAAAAVVLAVVGVTLAQRTETTSISLPGVASQEPIPHGMKAVDALGVEIFVPRDMAVDDNCAARSISRPVPLRVLPSCPPVSDAADTLRISIEPAASGSSAPCGSFSVTLAGETACVHELSGMSSGQFQWQLSWPRADVTITAMGRDESTAQRILRSAHAVPVDRNGCAARDSSLARAPQPAKGMFDAELLPTSTRRLSVCWYIGNRLVASALLDKAEAGQVIHVANGMAPKWPAPMPRPDLPSCDATAETDGVVLVAHRDAQPDFRAVTRFAACDGQRVSTSPTAAYLTSAELAAALTTATGIPLELGYTTK